MKVTGLEPLRRGEKLSVLMPGVGAVAAVSSRAQHVAG
jgi:hypothetical protein